MLKVKREGVILGKTLFGIEDEGAHSGYTLEDNAMALIAMCMYFKLTRDEEKIVDIRRYFNFVQKCHQPTGSFLNYAGRDGEFTSQNKTTTLDDANGKAIWALGYLSSISDLLPRELVIQARTLLNKSLNNIGMIRSSRAMAFAIKGLYYSYSSTNSHEQLEQIIKFTNRLVQMYKHDSNEKWEWFESHLTYANSILPEAMLYAWLLTGETIYKDIARTSLNFLLSQQTGDVAYTIMTLSKFYEEFKDEDYYNKMVTAFNFYGLEETHVNLNQGAESTISYLLARLTMEECQNSKKP